MIDKRVGSVAEALAGLKDGSVILLGGFGVVGQPQELLEGVIDSGARDLTIVSNNAGSGSPMLPKLFGTGQRVEADLQLSAPDAARIRGAVPARARSSSKWCRRERSPSASARRPSGIPAFYTPTSVGTKLGEGKETREFDGRALRDGARAACRCRADPGVERRPLGQSHLSRRGTEFQSGDGDGGGADGRADAAYRGAR